MRNIVVFTLTGVLIVANSVSVTGQDAGKKTAPKTGAQAGPKSSEKQSSTPPLSPTGNQPTASQLSPDEIAVRQTGETFVTAFNRGDAKATADHYTSDAEYIQENGHLIQGRQAIEESLKTFFADNPDRKLVMNIETIRFVATGIGIEDGTTTVTGAKDSNSVTTRYTAVHVKTAGKWLVASVRDFHVKPPRPHKNKLKQLDWMLGEWVHEGDDATIDFKCEPIENGNFLLRHFTIKIAGVETLSGSQRIGWEAQANKFRTWNFDSDGGHSDGYWHRDGDSWVLKTSGVTADGQPASCTSTFNYVNPHTMTFQSVDHEIAGVEIPDSPKITIVRRPPRPE